MNLKPFYEYLDTFFPKFSITDGDMEDHFRIRNNLKPEIADKNFNNICCLLSSSLPSVGHKDNEKNARLEHFSCCNKKQPEQVRIIWRFPILKL